jgi:hypothetical protein
MIDGIACADRWVKSAEYTLRSEHILKNEKYLKDLLASVRNWESVTSRWFYFRAGQPV